MSGEDHERRVALAFGWLCGQAEAKGIEIPSWVHNVRSDIDRRARGRSA